MPGPKLGAGAPALTGSLPAKNTDKQTDQVPEWWAPRWAWVHLLGSQEESLLLDPLLGLP